MAEPLILRASQKPSLPEILSTATCPACGHHLAARFYDGGQQPLTTLAWPKSEAEAQAMERLPLNFVRCCDCGHVYNKDFDYAKVPYSDKPNLMYNRGRMWKEHLALTAELLVEQLPENPTVIEIGAGDGHFLKSIAALINPNPNQAKSGKFIAFDPSGAMNVGESDVTFYPMLFDPLVHMAEYKPDLIICRHVMEHLTNPVGFIQALSFAAAWHGLDTAIFIEVPCIDRVFATHRTVDFFYEHNSHFTTESLNRMLTRSQATVTLIERGYDDEVVYGLATLGVQTAGVQATGKSLAMDATQFYNHGRNTDTSIQQALNALAERGKRIAIWGGTGKACTFINRYGLDNQRFPTVVDSDMAKVGTYVPGTGQVIRPPQVLHDEPTDIIVIATQWRAQDIALEIKERRIACAELLLEYQGELVNFHTGEHPYRIPARKDSAHNSKPARA